MIENAITSFSYKRDSPEEKMTIGNIGTGNISTLATFTTFDCRAMPNPYWDEARSIDFWDWCNGEHRANMLYYRCLEMRRT